MLDIPRNVVNTIWATVGRLGWSEKEFRDWMQDCFRKRRLHDLTQAEVRELVRLLKGMQDPGSRLSIGQVDLIRYWAKRCVRNPAKLEEYIRVVCKNVAGVDGIRFLTPMLARKVIEALKAAARRRWNRSQQV